RRTPKLAYHVFLIAVCFVILLTYVKWHLIPSASNNVLHGIMFDAGSTGTRIHVFKFTQASNEPPKLAHETFKAIKPGLSAYSDEPDKCTEGIQELLEIAKEAVPSGFWKATPLVLKATAGLRLLPGKKAQDLLNKVKEVFRASPFFVRDDCVSIMDGTDEGISAWITVNFLIGTLHGTERRTVGMLDLGGGSTQITFSPHDEKTVQTSPVEYITSFQMFQKIHTLYSHSYLGLGLMSARLAILGGTEGQPLQEGEELISPCLAPDYKSNWEHAEITYSIKGQKAGEPLYESCYNKVEKMLYKKVHKAEEVKDLDFYAFSYYYDRAVDVGLIDEEEGGSLKVEDFEVAAKRVCKSMESEPGVKPFLCLDLTYITVLLQEMGFPKDTVFKLARRIDNVETSWALGATFHYIDSLHRYGLA
uniref:nucleoside diphosphate phosphatase n=1 Tax=Latimeria chalumnae TaxID=7897 RepID=H3APR0_LATCH